MKLEKKTTYQIAANVGEVYVDENYCQKEWFSVESLKDYMLSEEEMKVIKRTQSYLGSLDYIDDTPENKECSDDEQNQRRALTKVIALFEQLEKQE